MGIVEPTKALDKKCVASHGRNALTERAVEPLDCGGHESHGDDADDNAESGKPAAKFIRAQSGEGNNGPLLDFLPESHDLPTA